MLFDRQVLYLAFLFASENVLGAPFSLPAVENVSVGLPSVVGTSAVLDVVAHATKTFRLQDTHASSNSPQSDHSSNVEYPAIDASLQSIPGASALATASPSGSSLTSPNVHELRDSLAQAAQSSEVPGNVKSGSLNAVERQQNDNMALPDIIARQDASATASAGANFNNVESIFNSVYNQVTSALATDAVSSAGAASSAGDALTTSVSVAARASDSPSPTTTNALNVLFSALPSDIASPLQSELNSVFPGIVGTTNTADSQTSPTGTRTNSPTNTSPMDRTTRPTGTRTRLPMTNTHHTTHPTPTTRPTHHTTLQTSSTSSTTSMTGTNTLTQADHTGGPAGAPPGIGAHPISNASIAGIVSGLGAGFVVAGLAGLYVFRRKKAGKPVIGGLGRGGSKRSTGSGPYPQVAWLYDPKMSPPAGNSRNGSVADGAEERLIPERPSSRGPVDDSAPEIAPVRPSSPLLAPHMPPARDRSPSPSRSRGARSLSIDASQGLLRPVSQE